MKIKVAALCVLLVVLVGCGGGDNAIEAPDEPGATSAEIEQAAPGTTPDVEKAAPGKVNQPTSGDYVYAYETETTNNSTPNATPARSDPGAELTSTISSRGDVTTAKDRSTEGTATSTIKQRWTATGVFDVSTRLESDQGSSGCEYSPQLLALRIPIKKETVPKQTLKGTGCGGERTISVEEQETIKDARGVEWSTWRIRVESVAKQPGLTKRNVDTRWFSPDLGKDVRIVGVAEFVNEKGAVAVRAEQSSTLKDYPKA